MALSTFAAVARPHLLAISSDVDPITSHATHIPQIAFALGAGDRMLVVMGYNSGTASVSSITNTGTALAWSRIGAILTVSGNRLEVWQSAVSAVAQLISVTVNMSTAVIGNMWIGQISNCTSFAINNVGFTAAAANSAVTATTPAPTAGAPNLIALSVMFFPSTAVLGTGTSPIEAVPADFYTGTQSGNNRTWNWYYSGSATPGDTTARFVTRSANAIGNFMTTGIICNGPTIQMDDLTWMCRDDGTNILLNNPAQTFPMYDIEDLQGMFDQTVNANVDEIDGSDGSYVSAKFLQAKSIVIDGTIYSSTSPFDQTLVDSLAMNFRPSATDDPVPLYYKLPGELLRCIFVKPTKLVSDVARPRSYGQVSWQAQLSAADPRSVNVNTTLRYVTANAGTATAPVFQDTVTALGNADVFPIIYFNVFPTDITGGVAGNFIFQSPTWERQYGVQSYTVGLIIAVNDPVTGVLMGNGPYGLDLANRRLLFYGLGGAPIDVSNLIVGRNWFGIVGGQQNIIILQKPTGGAGRIVNDGFSYPYADAWK